MWSELEIGSNRILNASGVISVMGEQQVHLERGHDVQLLLTMDLYDEEATHVAKLRRNAWVFHDGLYEITTHPSSLQLVHRATGNVVAEAQVLDRDRILVPRADFFARNGVRIVVEPEAVRIGGLTMKGNTFQGTNAMVTLDSEGVGIG